jgi:3-isopropylmalate dehydratase small subunit
MVNLKANCLRTLRPDFPEQVQPGDIIVAGDNFGCGSSRPTGVVALKACGVQAVVAESIARLYFRNGVAQGLLTFPAPGISGIVEDGDEIEIDYEKGIARNLASGKEVALRRFPPTVEKIYASGGIQKVIAERLTAEGFVSSRESV